MSFNTALVIDASCDLPKSFIDSHNLIILPVTVTTGDQEFDDYRDMKETLSFYRQALKSSKKVSASSPSAEAIIGILKDKLVTNYEAIQAITMHADWSDIHKNVTSVGFINKENFQTWRKQANLDPKFRLRVMDSGTLFTGQGLLVYEAVRLLKEKALSVDKLKKPLELFKPNIDTYIVVNNPTYLRNRDKRSDPSTSTTSTLDYYLGNMLGQKPAIRLFKGKTTQPFREKGFDNTLATVLDKVSEHIEDGLLRPIINTSYTGNLAEIRSNPEFTKFVAYAKSQQVRVLLSMGSMAAAANIGPGAFCVSFVPDLQHEED